MTHRRKRTETSRDHERKAPCVFNRSSTITTKRLKSRWLGTHPVNHIHLSESMFTVVVLLALSEVLKVSCKSQAQIEVASALW